MSALRVDLAAIIRDAIYDARNEGKTITVAADDAAEAVVRHLADELTRREYGDAFREAWRAADAEGRVGERVEAGMAAVARAVAS